MIPTIYQAPTDIGFRKNIDFVFIMTSTMQFRERRKTLNGVDLNDIEILTTELN